MIVQWEHATNPSSSSVGSKVALRLSGEIDMSNAQDLEHALEAGIEEGGPILIDVRDLTFIDSAGVHVWVQAAEALTNRGCLVIHGEQRHLSRLLDLLGVDDMVKNLHRVHRLAYEDVNLVNPGLTGHDHRCDAGGDGDGCNTLGHGRAALGS